MKSKAPEVSVIIPAYNEATYIDRLLEALVRQSFQDFEVIVSDAQSHDGTDGVIDSFRKNFEIKFIQAPPKGPSHGRNVGANTARGDWLLFLDADVDLEDKHFIQKLLDGTKAKNWNTSSAQLKVRKGSLLGRIGHNQPYMNFMAHTKHPIFQGYCMFTNRAIFQKLEGFNEKIHYGEDNDYATRSAPYGFGFVKSTYYLVDPRRYEQEGWKLLFKNIWHEVYRLTHRYNFENQKFTYEFGRHDARRKD